jgi:transglutaminase-like putative cysteine protease
MMIDLGHFQGTGQYGRAYRIMLESDPHAPGSVDRVLMEESIRLGHEPAPHLYGGYTPTVVTYRPGSRPELEAQAERVTDGYRTPEEAIRGIARFTAGLCEGAEAIDIESLRFGGTEEDIISRGSDWCTDVARVACVICQVVGVPARIVNLFDLTSAYSGHVVIEAYRGGTWGLVDPITSELHLNPDGSPTSAWHLMTCPRPAESEPGWSGCAAGIVNYFVEDRHRYDYTVSTVNDYYRPILWNSVRGWPGGLRWLHGEDGTRDGAGGR